MMYLRHLRHRPHILVQYHLHLRLHLLRNRSHFNSKFSCRHLRLRHLLLLYTHHRLHIIHHSQNMSRNLSHLHLLLHCQGMHHHLQNQNQNHSLSRHRLYQNFQRWSRQSLLYLHLLQSQSIQYRCLNYQILQRLKSHRHHRLLRNQNHIIHQKINRSRNLNHLRQLLHCLGIHRRPQFQFLFQNLSKHRLHQSLLRWSHQYLCHLRYPHCRSMQYQLWRSVLLNQHLHQYLCHRYQYLNLNHINHRSQNMSQNLNHLRQLLHCRGIQCHLQNQNQNHSRLSHRLYQNFLRWSPQLLCHLHLLQCRIIRFHTWRLVFMNHRHCRKFSLQYLHRNQNHISLQNIKKSQNLCHLHLLLHHQDINYHLQDQIPYRNLLAHHLHQCFLS